MANMMSDIEESVLQEWSRVRGKMHTQSAYATAMKSLETLREERARGAKKTTGWHYPVSTRRYKWQRLEEQGMVEGYYCLAYQRDVSGSARCRVWH